MKATFRHTVTIFVAAHFLEACLPGDTRPKPGTELFTISGGPDLEAARPIVTSDGWIVRFGTVLVFLESGSLYASITEPPTCEVYRNRIKSYSIFNLAIPGEKVIASFLAVGQCNAFLPRIDSPLVTQFADIPFGLADLNFGPGVGVEDLTTLSMSRESVFFPEESRKYDFFNNDTSSPAVMLTGTATKDDNVMAFTFKFSYPYNDYRLSCALNGEKKITVPGETTHVTAFTLRPDFLFADNFDEATAVVRFAPMAFAAARYANHSPQVTERELAQVRLSSLGLPASYPLPIPRYGNPSATNPPVDNVRDYIEQVLLSRALLVNGQRPCAEATSSSLEIP